MIELHIPEMSCGHCKKAVVSAVEAVDQSATVVIDMETRFAVIDTSAHVDELLSALAKAGYESTAV